MAIERRLARRYPADTEAVVAVAQLALLAVRARHARRSTPSRWSSSCRPPCSGRWPGRVRGCDRACPCGAASRSSRRRSSTSASGCTWAGGSGGTSSCCSRPAPSRSWRSSWRWSSWPSAALLGHELHAPTAGRRAQPARRRVARRRHGAGARGDRPASRPSSGDLRATGGPPSGGPPVRGVVVSGERPRISSRLARATRRASRRYRVSTGTSTARGTGFSPESRASRAASPLIIASNALALSRARVSSMRRRISAWSTLP